MFIHSPVDVVVLTMLLVVGLGILLAMMRGKRPVWATVGVAMVYGVFMGYELFSASSGNTISETVVALFPLPVLIGGTLVIAVILCVHWWDLHHRKA